MPRRPLAVLLTVAATAAATIAFQPVASSAEPAGDALRPGAHARTTVLQAAAKADEAAATSGTVHPAGPNPFLALVPDPAAVDYAGWRARVDAQGDVRAAERAGSAQRTATAPRVHEELERGTYGANDALATAEVIEGFGTRGRQDDAASVLGDLTNEPVDAPPLAPGPEDDGSIPLAQDTGIQTLRTGATVPAVIGDGPHGSAGTGSGDFDFYALELTAGRLLTAAVRTPTGALDPVAVLYDTTGEIVALNDDVAFPDTDSLLTFLVPATGTYVLMVSGFTGEGFEESIPNDPFDSASGLGAGSEGPYELVVTSGAADRDVFAVDVRAGDVLGASVTGGAARLAVLDPSGVERQGSQQDLSALYPAESPLPGGGNAVVAHVVLTEGRHYLAVSNGSGAYAVTFEAHRAGVQAERRGVQTLFVDLDGGAVDTAPLGGPGVRELSPLRAFLGGWGLGADDEDAVIDAIMATLLENLAADLAASGLNRQFEVRILNSRDHRDPLGQPNVTRIVVGGTIAESGLGTIGAAQSVDPGNFDHDEHALVLLDLLSRPAGRLGDPSLNTYLTEATEDRIGFIGQAVGNLASHETGHVLGSWHTDPSNEVADLMDLGGDWPQLFVVGEDGVGGTADDRDVDFGEDVYDPFEGFTGLQSTFGTTLFGLTRD